MSELVSCPKCWSEQISGGNQGFDLGKAAVGIRSIGPLGLLGGMIVSKKPLVCCLACGHQRLPQYCTAEQPGAFHPRPFNRNGIVRIVTQLVLVAVAGGGLASCRHDISRTDVERAIAKDFGGQFLNPIVLTGPAGIACRDLPAEATKNGYIRDLLHLVQDGQFQLVDSSFASDSTGKRGTHCAAVVTGKGQEHNWHEEHFFDSDGTPTRQATVEAGAMRVQVTGIVLPEPGDSMMIRKAEWRTWPELNALGRTLQLAPDTATFEGTFRRYDDGWHLLPEWKRRF